jgi:transposase
MPPTPKKVGPGCTGRSRGGRTTKIPADRAYDSNALRAEMAARGAWANIKPMKHRKDPPVFSSFIYRYRNQVEHFFNRLKHFRAALTDALGSLMRFVLLPGNRFDTVGVAPLIQDLEFGALIADKAARP